MDPHNEQLFTDIDPHNDQLPVGPDSSTGRALHLQHRGQVSTPVQAFLMRLMLKYLAYVQRFLTLNY